MQFLMACHIVCQDVYTEVAEIVRRRVAEDVVNGVPLSSEVLGEIDRKLVKQTVMTSVYGVTMSGLQPPPFCSAFY